MVFWFNSIIFGLKCCWWQNFVTIFYNQWNHFLCCVLILFFKNMNFHKKFVKFRFLGMSFQTHLYWVAPYLLVWQNNCFINPKSASSELLNEILRNEFRTEHRRFLPHFPKKSNSKSVNLRTNTGGSMNDFKTYLIFWSPLRRPCETKLPKLAEINCVKKSCPSFWRPFSNSNINIAIELAF